MGCGIHRAERQKERENLFSLTIFGTCGARSCAQHLTYGPAAVAIFHLLREGKKVGVPGWFIRIDRVAKKHTQRTTSPAQQLASVLGG